MVTGEYLRQKLVKPLIEKQRAEGRAKGRAEEREVWEAWNRRRLDAESKGEPFDEAPPSLEQNSSNGS